MARCSRNSPQSLHWEAIMEDRVVVGVTRPDWLTLSERRGPLNEHDGRVTAFVKASDVILATED